MILRSCVILWNERFKGGDWELLCKDYERQMSGRGWSSPEMKGAVLWSGGLTIRHRFVGCGSGDRPISSKTSCRTDIRLGSLSN